MYLENVIRKQLQHESDEFFMQQAISMAKKGMFSTSPNPRVGCVIVQEGKIIARGFHAFCGEPHAEVLAIAEADARKFPLKGATVYVTLEPCNHQGRMPPCTEALIVAGVKNIVIGSIDPDPRVNGNGIERLRQSGMEVRIGIRQEECDRLNPGFFKRMKTGLPYVRVKTAASLDGKTAMPDGESQWITGKKAREDVHFQRLRADAVITGIGSILADDPRMNARYHTVLPSRQPIRVILDSKLRTPPDAAIFKVDEPIIIVCALKDIPSDHPLYQHKQLSILSLPDAEKKQVDLEAVLFELAKHGVNEVLVEAGSQLSGSFISNGLFDELLIYLAPSLLGASGRSMYELPGISELKEKIRLCHKETHKLGDDLLLSYTPER